MNSSKLLNRKDHSNDNMNIRVLSGMSKNSKKSQGVSQKSGDQRGRLVLQSAHAGGKKDSIISTHSGTVGPHQGGSGAIFQSSQRFDNNREMLRNLTT